MATLDSPSHVESVAVSLCSHQPCVSWTEIRSVALSAAGEAGARIFSNTTWKVENRLPITPRQFRSLLHVLSAALFLPTQKIQSTAYFSQAEKRTCVSSASTLFCLALLTGGGGVFILWKLEEAKQFRLLRWVGVCLCVCSFLSMWRSPLSYLLMVSVCCPLLSVDRRGKGRKQAPGFFPLLLRES